MNAFIKIGAAIGLFALSACNPSPREQAAENVEANYEMQADNLEAAAGNAGSGAAELALENQAEVTREAGDNAAKDMRTNDPDTNLANGM